MEDGGWRMKDGGWRMEDGGWRRMVERSSYTHTVPPQAPARWRIIKITIITIIRFQEKIQILQTK